MSELEPKNAVAWGTLLVIPLVTGDCTPLKSDADRGSPTDAGADCAHRQPPPRPLTDGGGSLVLVFAASHVDYGYKSFDDAGLPRYLDIGFDLDDTCTGEGEGPSCDEPPWATVYNDGRDGIDNAAGRAGWQEAADSVQVAGATNLVLRVSDYSGDDNDDQVEVSLYYSPGLIPTSDGGVDPVWDGLDRWSIVPDSLLPPTGDGSPSVDQPKFVDKQAYVSNRFLVSRLDAAIVPALLSGLPVLCRHAVMAGALIQGNDGLWELHNVVIGYRLALNDILYNAAWGLGVGPGSTYSYCQDPAVYNTTGKAFCSFADIGYEEDSPTAQCDALSAAFAFDAKQALLGDVKDVSRDLPVCDPTVDPTRTTCESLRGGD